MVSLKKKGARQKTPPTRIGGHYLVSFKKKRMATKNTLRGVFCSGEKTAVKTVLLLKESTSSKNTKNTENTLILTRFQNIEVRARRACLKNAAHVLNIRFCPRMEK